MKKYFFILLFMPCWCWVSGQKGKQDTIPLPEGVYSTFDENGFKSVHVDTTIWQRKKIRLDGYGYINPTTGVWEFEDDLYILDTVPQRIRPTYPEPAKPSILNPIGIFKTDEGVIKDLVLLIDSLKIELYKCQEKSKVDELIIERLFEGIKKEGITVPAKLYTATYDSLGNIYFKEK